MLLYIVFAPHRPKLRLLLFYLGVRRAEINVCLLHTFPHYPLPSHFLANIHELNDSIFTRCCMHMYAVDTFSLLSNLNF